MSIHYLVYVSQADAKLTGSDIEKILDQSRRNNKGAGVSGMLLFVEGRDGRRGSFMQLLEGAETELEKLQNKIFADPRHHTKLVLEQGSKPGRDFADWSMAYKTASSTDLANHPTFSGLGEDHFSQRCEGEQISGSCEFLIDFWEAEN